MFREEHWRRLANRSSRNTVILEGPIVNAVAIGVGVLIGHLAGSRLNASFRELALRAMGLVVVIIGFQMSWPMPSPVILLLSLVGGAFLGEWWHVEDGLQGLGRWVERRIAGADTGQWARGFVSASLIFNVGPLAILGAIQAGIGKTPTLLLTKSVLDGVTGLVLTAAMGWGVIGAAVVTLVYEGGIALAAGAVSRVLPHDVITEFSVVGGILIAALGVNFVAGRQLLRVGNLLPGLLLAAGLAWLHLP